MIGAKEENGASVTELPIADSSCIGKRLALPPHLLHWYFRSSSNLFTFVVTHHCTHERSRHDIGIHASNDWPPNPLARAHIEHVAPPPRADAIASTHARIFCNYMWGSNHSNHKSVHSKWKHHLFTKRYSSVFLIHFYLDAKLTYMHCAWIGESKYGCMWSTDETSWRAAEWNEEWR